jgi:hypothetical protein
MALALDWFGGAGRPEAWSAVFAAIRAGPGCRRMRGGGCLPASRPGLI